MADAPAVTLRQMVIDDHGRLVRVERFVDRAEPALFDPKDGLVPRMQSVEDRQERIDAMWSMVRWTLTFAGAGFLVMVLDVIGQAAGILK